MKTKITICIIGLALMIVGFKVNAQDIISGQISNYSLFQCVEGVHYICGNDWLSVNVCGVNADLSGDLIIPDSVCLSDGIVYAVKGICVPPCYEQDLDAYVFSDNICNIVLPASITHIDSFAFANSSQLESVTLNTELVSISDKAFLNCRNLETIKSDGDIAIEGDPFMGCVIFNKNNYSRALFEPVILGGNLLKRIGLFAKSYTIPTGVKTIFRGALYDECKIDTLIVPEGVVEIQDKSMRVMKAIILPESLERLSADAFFTSGLTSINIPKNVSAITYSQYDSEVIRPAWESICVNDNNNCYDSRNNCNAVIETSTSTLIMGCKNTVVPNGVVAIGEKSFSYCQGLISIVLPASVLSISNSAFYNCYDLKMVTLSDSLNIIDDKAFEGCWNLVSINCPDKLIELGDNALAGTSIDSFTLPSGFLKLGAGAFSGTKIKRITIPQNVVSIGQGAFAGCDDLKKIKVDKNNNHYKSIRGKALVELSSKTLIASIGPGIPSVIDAVGDAASLGNRLLKALYLPSGVISVGRGSFQSCPNLSSVYIPASLRIIDSYAFGLCNNICDVYNYSAVPQEIDETVFSVYKTLHVKKGCKELYMNTAVWNKFTVVDDLEE